MFAGMNPSATPSLAPHHMALIPQERLAEIQKEYFTELAHIATNPEAIEVKDRRFAGKAWHSSWSKVIAATYLLNSKHLMSLAKAVETDEKTRQKILFATEQMIDALSPSNFMATNPEVIENIISTQGQSIQKGIVNLLGDMKKGKVSITDESAFEVGKNIATTEGHVVFRNELFELIQYTPLTETVFERPYLMVPPCINKYYILDLQPDNSVVRHMVAQGHTVFLVSWKNPDASMAKVSWDDYVGKGVIKAIEVVQDISESKQINILGFCVGGTLTTSALAVLAARDEHPAASLTLFTTLLDFTNTGILDVFIDEAMVELRENTIGGKTGTYGMMSGLDLGNTFSFLRPNDLVWNYVVDNYLKGNSPPPFDLLYWNGDSTNLPGNMYCWYLRHTYLQNDLVKPGKVTICGEKIDLGKIKCPAYLYASQEDHIVPWQSAYESTHILKGKNRFVLGASGHIAGVINPPAKNKRYYFENNKIAPTAEEWLADAKQIPGSWWPNYTKWLEQFGGEQKPAPSNFGNAKYKKMEAAPGVYVKEKAA
ncbi:MAG: class I poly(R)-hydroxyalkanoic acid synthase [Polynucleobacter sp.]|uniref:class I poly(R)-hydroxyalkanoic acid synthase n=1 Tax=Polynucleobacter sp. TaxID=2029855 RepID=UPI00216E194E|nr:class I poly(R)-hydroxyalkanoic acid synthase [Polynucleobacter sp.]MBU3669393.1 class I poly(R)-hydroxyalkanoic acid synthase [Polynucleobacter sp.]MCW1965955.1 class I poly(R)-hydroxyalkanoic acid synthase [Polynucleobacter sp.]